MSTSAISLPVISLLNEVMIIQGYLRAVTATSVPSVITQNPQYATLVTNFTDWQSDLWGEFWEGLLSANIIAQSQEINTFYKNEVTDESIMRNVFYNGTVPTCVGLCDSVANMVTNGQPLLQQLETIAESIADADAAAVAKCTALATKLSAQFDEQEDKLTQSAFDSGADVVATAIDVAIAVGTEGEDIAPLVKGVMKIGEDVINELNLSAEINQTIGDLQSAWAALDKATTDLAQITLTCRQLKAVTDDASRTLIALQKLSSDWSAVADVTNLSADDWTKSGSAALQTWAAQMVRMSFGYATQTVSATS